MFGSHLSVAGGLHKALLEAERLGFSTTRVFTKGAITQSCGLAIERKAAYPWCSLIRGHWSVENNLHWQLDVSFREDERRIRKGHGAENFSRLCRMALNMLKNEKSQKTGIAIKRQTCGWNNDYLLKILQA